MHTMLAMERTFPHFSGLTGPDRKGMLISKGETLESLHSASGLADLWCCMDVCPLPYFSRVVLLRKFAQG